MPLPDFDVFPFSLDENVQHAFHADQTNWENGIVLARLRSERKQRKFFLSWKAATAAETAYFKEFCNDRMGSGPFTFTIPDSSPPETIDARIVSDVKIIWLSASHSDIKVEIAEVF